MRRTITPLNALFADTDLGDAGGTEEFWTAMTFERRLTEIRECSKASLFDCLVTAHDGAHFIEKARG